MTMTKKPLTNLEMWEALTDVTSQTAHDEWEAPRTLDEKLAVDRVHAEAHVLLHKLRQKAFAELCESTPQAKRSPMPEHLLAMSRDALIVRLDKLRLEAGVSTDNHFRKLEELDDDELRAWVMDMEQLLAERKKRKRPS